MELKPLVQRDGGAVTRSAEMVILLFEVLEKRRLRVEDESPANLERSEDVAGQCGAEEK